MGDWVPVFLVLGSVGLAALTLLLLPALAKPSAPRSDGSLESIPGPRESIARRFTAPSCAIFKPGCRIRIVGLEIPGGSADVELSTEYLDGWGPIQHELVARAIEVSSTMEGSIPSLPERLSHIAATLSLSANAWVGDLEVSSPETPATAVNDHPRELDEELAGALIERIGAHLEARALNDVLECYRKGLLCWNPEAQAVALAWLHSGLRSMVPVLTRHMAHSRGIEPSELAKLFGVSLKGLPDRVLETELYRDDALCLHAAGLAWQATVQGSGESDAYYVEGAHVAAARYLRASILRVLELEPEIHARLIRAPYDVPFGLYWPTAGATRLQQDRLLNPLALPGLEPGFGG